MTMLAEAKTMVRKIAPGFILGGYHLALAFIAAVRFGFPSNKLKVIGVTGTNGKSTTVKLINTILKEAGYKTALSSSIEFEIAGKISKNSSNNSMPGRFAIQRLLARAVAEKCDYAIIEVTSEGILQNRHKFINFNTAVFTNLSPEHIERHKGFDNYRRAKQELFRAVKTIHVVNRDDDSADFFLAFEAKEKYCYGINENRQRQSNCIEVIADKIRIGTDGVEFFIDSIKFKNKLAGKFNVYNCLAATSAALSQGITLEVCAKALARVRTIPGRMEKISDEPVAFIDYAFTPNALEKVYDTIKSNFLKKDGKMICLLGACGGGRDKWKRPILGQIAGRYCDKIVLADEDPWGEDAQKIIKMVESGVLKAGFCPKELYKIPDRRKAIVRAVSLAGLNDVLVFTGKGSEAWIRLGGDKKIPWNEKQVVLEELAKKKN